MTRSIELSGGEISYKQELERLKQNLRNLDEHTGSMQIKSELGGLISEIEHIHSKEQYEIWLRNKIEGSKIEELKNILKDAEKEFNRFKESQKQDLDALKEIVLKTKGGKSIKDMKPEELAMMADRGRMGAGENVINDIDAISRGDGFLAKIMKIFKDKI